MATEPSDAQYLRCLKCMQIIKCSRYDTNVLVEHVQTAHPEIINKANEKVQNLYKLAAEHGISEGRVSEISRKTGLSEAEMADHAERYVNKHKQAKQQQLDHGQQSVKSKTHHHRPNHVPMKFNVPISKDSSELNRNNLYRTSIERWVPTDGCISCPRCGQLRRPLLRTSVEFYAATGCSAACVANCWPFCFLPCLNSGDNREYLHCSECKTFLGIYDRENNCIRPNREFVHEKKSR